MAEKKAPETPEDQSERFKREAQKLIDAGELNPTDAARRLDSLVRKSSAEGRFDSTRTPD